MTFLSRLEAVAADLRSGPVYLYGAGGMGADFLDFARENNTDIAGFIDSNLDRVGTVHHGLPIVELEIARAANAHIVITTSKHLEVRARLADYSVGHVLHTKAGALALSPDTIALYDYLADEASRETLASLFDYFCGHISRPAHSLYPQYQHPTLDFPNIRTIVDAGAYDAGVFRRFQGICSDRMKAYLFEPIASNAVTIRATIGDTEQAVVVQKGLWSHETELVFEESLAASRARADLDDGMRLPVVNLDSLVLDVDLIKMDIEGSEQKALEGAAKTINRCSPNMAISIYHNFRDFVVIPKLLIEKLPDHRYFLGHHYSQSAPSGYFMEYETVFYALRAA
ncbi:FkbM family methyltransferase [Pseudokordiimonas caeni]|uniref:FkbM family methyltransferase n=1 Tax=Pseudokordiimonas caeni TaxID=2997908 RepID=UPI0028113F3C|nr:FkbM family methyltransferase [Pseudokordiimonas caeni]